MGLADIDSFLLPAPHLGEEGVLEVAYLPQNSPTTAVLFHPNPMGGGAMTNKVVSTLYRYARDQGHDVIRYNSRGVGRSSGTITAGLTEFEDAVCVLKWAMAQGTRRFWLGGFSFGGYMACLSADWLIKQSAEQDTAVDALCLIAPSIVRHNVHKLVLPAHRFLVYGDSDELVSPVALAQFAQERSLPHRVLAAGHFFHGKLGELKQAVAQLDGQSMRTDSQ